MRDLVVFFRVLEVRVRLSLVWDDHLDVPLGSQCATIEEWNASIDTLGVNEKSSGDIIKGIGNHGLLSEELLCVDMVCVFVKFIESR